MRASLPWWQGTLAQMRRGTGALRQVGRGAIDFLYPGACVLCQCDARSAALLCERCLGELEEAGQEPGCPACGKPVADAAGPCPWCSGDGTGRIKRLARLGLMEGPLRQLIHLAKYRGRWELADWLGRRLADHPPACQLLAEADVLIPVPLHALRQVNRGYNQSLLIARQLSRRHGKPIVQPVARARSTAAQTSLVSVTARQANVRDAFVLLEPDLVAGRRIVLVDDVTTTGATLRSLAHCLHAARPASQGALVVALADPRSKRLPDMLE